MKLSASRLPLVARCIGAAALPSVQEESSDAATAGTGRHTFLRRAAEIGRDAALAEIPADASWRSTCEGIDTDALPRGDWEVAYAYHPETDTARILGHDMARDYSAAEADEITGTADLITTHEGIPWVIDFKGSESVDDPAQNLQLGFYALAHCRVIGRDEARVSIAYVHTDGHVEWVHARLDGWDLETIASRVRAIWSRAREAREAYTHRGLTPDLAAGSHCRYCPSFALCPAQVTLAYELVTARDEMTAEGVLKLDDAQAGAAWVKVGLYREILERIEASLRVRAQIRGLPLPDGSQLVVQESTRKTLDVEKALPILRALIGDRAETFVDRSIASSVVETVSREVALARGEKVKATREGVWTALRGARAVREQTYTQLRVKKPRAAAQGTEGGDE